MNHSSRVYIISNITLPIDASYQEAFSVARRRLSKIGVDTHGVSFEIYKKSTDARKRGNVRFVYSVLACGENLYIPDKDLSVNGISMLVKESPVFKLGNTPIDDDIVVVGTGPCGMFCALMLAELGYPVTLIEQGGTVSERKAAFDRFCTRRVLDSRTNIQFGAGGAGTFSDGKLITRVNDPLGAFVLDKLVEFGAPRSITYLARPHIGTDVLSRVVEGLLSRIEELGGSVLYHTKMLDFVSQNGKVGLVKTDNGDIPASALVLAIGHSARDTYITLVKKGLAIEAKAFSVGMRIEHLAKDIDYALYGDMAGHPKLGHAEYNLSYNTKERGVYSFCMCPGGVVVPAASEEGGVVVNGMSYHSRDGKNSNSAILCSIFKDDYGATPMAAIEFQRKIEQAAFIAAGATYDAPMVTVGDMLSGRHGTEPSYVSPTYMNGGVIPCDPRAYLPAYVCDSISDGIKFFDKKINGFARCDAVLTGPETRTSAPLRILRDPQTRLAIGYTNLYPSGEGAGYAGGITSAAIDGIKTAIEIASVFLPKA